MKYRHPLAQAIHSSLLAYITTPTKRALLTFKNALRATNEESLLETSLSGHSHLIDIFHLPSEFCKDTVLAGQITSQLLRSLLIVCRAFSASGATILVQPTHAGFTPLHQVLKSGSAENLRMYFQAVREACEEELITEATYEALLVGVNEDGFTPLHEVLIAGNIEKFHIYMDAVHEACSRNVRFKNNSYQYLLTAPNNALYTPLHSAANSGNYDLLTAFVAELERNFNLRSLEHAFNAKTNSQHRPSCQAFKEGASRINKFIGKKREHIIQQLAEFRGQCELGKQNGHRFFSAPLHRIVNSNNNAENKRTKQFFSKKTPAFPLKEQDLTTASSHNPWQAKPRKVYLESPKNHSSYPHSVVRSMP